MRLVDTFVVAQPLENEFDRKSINRGDLRPWRWTYADTGNGTEMFYLPFALYADPPSNTHELIEVNVESHTVKFLGLFQSAINAELNCEQRDRVYDALVQMHFVSTRQCKGARCTLYKVGDLGHSTKLTKSCQEFFTSNSKTCTSLAESCEQRWFLLWMYSCLKIMISTRCTNFFLSLIYLRATNSTMDRSFWTHYRFQWNRLYVYYDWIRLFGRRKKASFFFSVPLKHICK